MWIIVSRFVRRSGLTTMFRFVFAMLSILLIWTDAITGRAWGNVRPMRRPAIAARGSARRPLRSSYLVVLAGSGVRQCNELRGTSGAGRQQVGCEQDPIRIEIGADAGDVAQCDVAHLERARLAAVGFTAILSSVVRVRWTLDLRSGSA